MTERWRALQEDCIYTLRLSIRSQYLFWRLENLESSRLFRFQNQKQLPGRLIL